ncbi:hypothetical protein HPB48_022457 [Haemaphysalis longicornis]|uniref:glutathione-specific gamma-glutamylcyclotransferase n=1 Tax=Haemaphysalis longicornis TaxID=44386 RepID=A0A9J6FTA2_HAELO|nr:hypothetical protein HPB48_022457 [Haemaphysalis longicornis]
MWVFGYGSLMWKADFPYDRKLSRLREGLRASVLAGQRRPPRGSWQGRVVTLVPVFGARVDCVWGIAYEIPDKKKTDVITQLDFREKDGYDRVCSFFSFFGIGLHAVKATNEFIVLIIARFSIV